MIWGRFEEPNFKFAALDEQGKNVSYFCRAQSEQELRKRLMVKGLRVLAIEPYQFSEWKDRARVATDKAIWQRIRDRWVHFGPQIRKVFPWLSDADLVNIAGLKKKLIQAVQMHDACTEDAAARQVDAWTSQLQEEQVPIGGVAAKTAISFNQKLWGEMKWHLFELFHAKCAYCESKPLATESGDVEHYRPKGKVDEDESHPGYYWLAYDETNLLPSCESCNRQLAKMTHFPVDGIHAHDPPGIPVERPLLLNPYNRAIDPSDHIEFGANGVSKERNASQHGLMSRDWYHLDRPGLTEARFAAMNLVDQSWRIRIGLRTSIAGAFTELKNEILGGEQPYSLALLCELTRCRERTVKELEAL